MFEKASYENGTFLKFKWVSTMFVPKTSVSALHSTLRKEAIKLILELSPNSPQWISEYNYFRHIRTATDVLMFANCNAPFQNEVYDLLNWFYYYKDNYPKINVYTDRCGGTLRINCVRFATGFLGR